MWIWGNLQRARPCEKHCLVCELCNLRLKKRYVIVRMKEEQPSISDFIIGSQHKTLGHCPLGTCFRHWKSVLI